VSIKITRQEFRLLADAAVEAVGYAEGWCAEHPSWKIDKTGSVVGAAPRFRAAFTRELWKRGFSITRLKASGR